MGLPYLLISILIQHNIEFFFFFWICLVGEPNVSVISVLDSAG